MNHNLVGLIVMAIVMPAAPLLGIALLRACAAAYNVLVRRLAPRHSAAWQWEVGALDDEEIAL